MDSYESISFLKYAQTREGNLLFMLCTVTNVTLLIGKNNPNKSFRFKFEAHNNIKSSKKKKEREREKKLGNTWMRNH